MSNKKYLAKELDTNKTKGIQSLPYFLNVTISKS